MNNELRNQRISFIWYNDDELFRYTDEDFDRKPKAYADGGVMYAFGLKDKWGSDTIHFFSSDDLDNRDPAMPTASRVRRI